MTDFKGRQVGYIEGATRQVPGLESLHRMTSMLLGEKAPDKGRILVVGAGGGLELKALAKANNGWIFDGVDPSPDMLALARETTTDYAARINLHEGDISAAPDEPFDGAACLLVFHHLRLEERIKTLNGVRQRLRPGAPFVLAHVSFPQNEPERSTWIDRHISYGAMEGTDPAKLQGGRAAMRERLSILHPEKEEALLRDSGFDGITNFYTAFSFRGWVAYAGPNKPGD